MMVLDRFTTPDGIWCLLIGETLDNYMIYLYRLDSRVEKIRLGFRKLKAEDKAKIKMLRLIDLELMEHTIRLGRKITVI